MRIALGLFVGCSLTALSIPVFATTYYVNPAGGTAAQCTGLADAAYPGSGSKQACAFSHPEFAIQPGQLASNFTPATVLKPGDKLIIDAGSYMIGYGVAGIPDNNECYQPATWGCDLSGIPSGIDAAHPTVITGASCSNRPQLWGTQRVGSIFDLENKHDIQINCLELTDHSACIESYGGAGPTQACNRNTYPYGTWAGAGIYASNMTNLSLFGLNIHGFANQGIQAGGLHGFTMDSTVIRANGWVGFNGDLGGGGPPSSNSGTILIQNSSIQWNGCTEAYPATTIASCWAQQEGGYGDGLGTAKTGGNWQVINSSFLDNTSDGLDLLYMDGTGSLFVDRVAAGFNAGNQVKVSGNATVQNSVINGTCNSLARFGLSAGDLCRAEGGAIALAWAGQNEVQTIAYNTVTGNGNCLLQGQDDGTDHTNSLTLANNIFLGQTSVKGSTTGGPICLAWYTDGTASQKTTYTNNIIWKVKDNVCPAGSICKDPKLANETTADFAPTPLSGSPAIDAALKLVILPVDGLGHSRPVGAGYDIGAIQR